MSEPGGREAIHRSFKERRILIIILHECSQPKLAKVFRVFLIGEAVGGDVLRA